MKGNCRQTFGVYPAISRGNIRQGKPQTTVQTTKGIAPTELADAGCQQ